MQRPLRPGGGNRAPLDEHSHQLFHVEGVAFGAPGNEFGQRGRHLGKALEQLAGELAALACVEHAEVDAPMSIGWPDGGDVAAPLEQDRTRQGDDEQCHVAVHIEQVFQELERTVVGPVEILEQQDDRGTVRACDAAHQLRGSVEGAVADLARVVAYAGNMRAVVKIQSDQVAQQVGVGLGELRTVVGHEEGRDASLELALRVVHPVAVGDAQLPGERVAQQAEGLARGVGRGAATQDAHACACARQPTLELAQQSALAQAGFGDHRDHRQPPVGDHSRERVCQRRKLGVPPDHARFHTLDAAPRGVEGAGPGALHKIGNDRRIDALDRDRGLRLDVECAAHLLPGVVADAQPAGRRRLLHARGNIDGNAADAGVAIDAAAEQHTAGMDAHAHPKAQVTMLQSHFLAERAALGQQLKPASHGTLGVVLARLDCAEDREQVVTRVLQHPAKVRFDDSGAACERAIHHGMDVLRIQVLAELRRADHVEKEDRDQLEGLLMVDFGRRLLHEGGQAGAQRRETGIHERVAEQAALSLKPADHRFKLFPFRGHGDQA